jgi:hypothetical protein
MPKRSPNLPKHFLDYEKALEKEIAARIKARRLQQGTEYVNDFETLISIN